VIYLSVHICFFSQYTCKTLGKKLLVFLNPAIFFLPQTQKKILSDNDAAGAPGVQFNLNDQVFQIFAFLLLAKEPVTPLRSSQK
jgi:hypothetical protein